MIAAARMRITPATAIGSGWRSFWPVIAAAVMATVMIIAAREKAARKRQCDDNQRQRRNSRMFHALHMGSAAPATT